MRSRSDELVKYPRTPHLEGSRHGFGDDAGDVSFDELRGVPLVVEEKLDGANSGISFDASGVLRLQSRGHYLTGGPRERHFGPLKAWAACHGRALWSALGDRYVMYLENMTAKHTVFYDDLPHLFFEFDVLDRRDGSFLDTPSRQALLAAVPVVSVPVLGAGRFERLGALLALHGPSQYVTANATAALAAAATAVGVRAERAVAETDLSGYAEGLYVKREEGGVVTGRYKWVRDGFTQTLDGTGSHWLDRTVIPNRLRPGTDLFASR